jgi:uncharacterized protein (DUF433 family)
MFEKIPTGKISMGIHASRRSFDLLLRFNERSQECKRELTMAVPEPLITISPDRLSGTPVFAGTRVPVQTLIEYLAAGDSLEAFLDDFPNVSREHAVAVLELAKSALLTGRPSEDSLRKIWDNPDDADYDVL